MEDSMPLWKTKTFWGGIAGVVAAVSGYLTGDMTLAAAISAGVVALTMVFQRVAIAKNGTGR